MKVYLLRTIQEGSCHLDGFYEDQTFIFSRKRDRDRLYKRLAEINAARYSTKVVDDNMFPEDYLNEHVEIEDIVVEANLDSNPFNKRFKVLNSKTEAIVQEWKSFDELYPNG